MMQKGNAVRRSRRAASLTAQVLWNIQIEEDNKSPQKVERKPSVTLEEESDHQPTQSKRGRRKRSAVETDLPTKVYSSSGPVKNSKKLKLSTGCSGHLFPVSKPVQLGRDSKTHGKLTASVAPLIQTPVKNKPTNATPTVPTNPPTPSLPHVNPILLLPVSLQTNQGPGHVGTAEVGNLPVLTLTTPDFLNCLNFNKTVVSSSNSRKQWTGDRSPAHNMPLGFKTSANNNNALMAKLSRSRIQTFSNVTSNQLSVAGHSTQVEPLNLKMGETTVPSSSKAVSFKPKLSQSRQTKHCNISLPRSSERDSVKLPASEAKKLSNTANRLTVSVKPSTARSKSQRRVSRSSPVTVPSTSNVYKKVETKCPSPDYACSSPDVDDVQLPPRHTCNRPYIKLRNKAAPPPGSEDYATVEMQRRIWAKLKRRAQKAKEKNIAKKPKARRKNTNESRSTPSPEASPMPSTIEEANNGWKWTGKPYLSLAYSVENGKHVKRLCYPGMVRSDSDGESRVLVRDCVFVLAGGEDEELPYVAKVSALWEKPHTKEMMMSLIWYYRPEHTEGSKPHERNVCEDELFASRHQDEISVACVEERCAVLTYMQYCREQARLRQDGMWRKNDIRNIVPKSQTKKRPMFSGESPLDPNDMFFCHKLYDVKRKKIRTSFPHPSSLWHDHSKRNTVSCS